MKKLIFTTAILAGLSLATYAQNSPKKTKSEGTKTTKSTPTITPTSCGEKGHVCTAECKKAEAKSSGTAAMKEHSCTSACTENTHMYACGEKGHTCTSECKKMK